MPDIPATESKNAMDISEAYLRSLPVELRSVPSSGETLTSIPFIVEAVSIDTIDISTMGGHHDLVSGSTNVTLRATDESRDRIDLDWTYRGDPPDTGSRWLLRHEEKP